MKRNTDPKTENTVLETPIQQLLEQIPALLHANQEVGALCNFYWVLHAAERGFLEKTAVSLLLQEHIKILDLCSSQEKITVCKRLAKLTETFHLDAEGINIDHQLAQLEGSREDKPPTIQFIAPDSKNDRSHLEALKYLTSARQRLSRLSNEERKDLEITNTQQLNLLEMQYHYDLVTSIYIEQLKIVRQESAGEVITVLKNIDHFSKKLRSQGLYVQAQTLHYQTAETLSMQQPFYENTCLNDVDERFLLETLYALNESALGRPISQAETTYCWSDNLATLQELRADKKMHVDKLMSSIDDVRYTPEVIDAIEHLQQNITQSMKTFFARLFQQAEQLLGEPPCDYSLIALGSIARGDMTPYSDLESVLLTEKPCANGSFEKLYFETLWHLFKFQINALGESFSENPGLHIDGECHPLLPELLTTPEKLIDTYGLKAINIDEESEGQLALTLLHSTVIYAHEHADKPETLWSRYHRLLHETLITDTPVRQQKANEHLQQAFDTFKTKTAPDFNAGCSVKNDFLGPLAYLLADLNFYHQLGAINHTELLKQLAEKKILDTAFANHCRTAIAELNLWRLHQHFHANQAQDVFPTDLATHQEERLKQLWYGLLQPFCAAAYQLTQATEPTHPVFNILSQLTDETLSPEKEKQQAILTPLLHYLLYTQSPNNPYSLFIDLYHRLPVVWRSLFLKRIEEIIQWPIEPRYQQETLTSLKAQPNPDGWQPRMDRETSDWKEAVLKLLLPLSPDALEQAIKKEKIIVYLACEGVEEAYSLKEDVFKQLFDETENPKQNPKNQPGRHRNLRVNYDGHCFWFKFAPEQPGTEYAINRLERYLGGQGTPMTQIIKLSRSNDQGMAIQISSHILGSSLEESLIKHPQQVTQIDIASFTQTLLRVLLTNPEDDKGNDYFLVPSDDGKKYHLKRIDNERAYYQPDRIQSSIPTSMQRFFNLSRQLQVKSILYCLEHMFLSLDEDTLTKYLRLDTYAMLERWLQVLKKEQDGYSILFNEQEIRFHFRNKEPDPSMLGIPMAEDLIKELLKRLDSIQEIIRLHRVRQEPTTGMDLLKVVQPQLANYYQKAFATHPIHIKSETHSSLMEIATQQARNILKRFNMVTQGLYQPTTHGHHQSYYSSIKAISESLRLRTEITEVDAIAIAKGIKMSPNQSLKMLKQLQKIQITDMPHAILNEQKDSLSQFQALPVRHQLLIIHEIIISIKKGLHLTKKQEIHCLKAFAGIPFHELNLSYFHEALSDELLIPLLTGAHKHLIILDLSNCYLLTNRSIEAIARLCPHLEELKLNDIYNPKAYNSWFFKSSYKFVSIDNLAFPSLKRLDISGSKELKSMELAAPSLVALFADGCLQLSSVKTGSLMLSQASFQYNKSLRGLGLVNLASLPEQLKALTLRGCDLEHINFREQYPEMGTALLGAFSHSEISKFNSWLEETLKKSGYSWNTLPLITMSAFLKSVRLFCSRRMQAGYKISTQLMYAAHDIERLSRRPESIESRGATIDIGHIRRMSGDRLLILHSDLKEISNDLIQKTYLAFGHSRVHPYAVTEAFLQRMDGKDSSLASRFSIETTQPSFFSPPAFPPWTIDIDRADKRFFEAMNAEKWKDESFIASVVRTCLGMKLLLNKLETVLKELPIKPNASTIDKHVDRNIIEFTKTHSPEVKTI